MGTLKVTLGSLFGSAGFRTLLLSSARLLNHPSTVFFCPGSPQTKMSPSSAANPVEQNSGGPTAEALLPEPEAPPTEETLMN